MVEREDHVRSPLISRSLAPRWPARKNSGQRQLNSPNPTGATPSVRHTPTGCRDSRKADRSCRSRNEAVGGDGADFARGQEPGIDAGGLIMRWHPAVRQASTSNVGPLHHATIILRWVPERPRCRVDPRRGADLGDARVPCPRLRATDPKIRARDDPICPPVPGVQPITCPRLRDIRADKSRAVELPGVSS